MGENTRISPRHKPNGSGNDQQPTVLNIPLPPWITNVVEISDRIFAAALAIGGLALLVLLAMLTLGKFDAGWIFNVSALFAFAFCIGFLAVLLAKYESFVPGWIGLILGAGFVYGAEIGLGYLAARGHVSGDLAQFKNFIQTVQNVGLFTAVFCVLRLLLGYTVAYLTRYESNKSKRCQYMDTSTEGTQKPSLVPTCWQMSRCRPGVRMTCPNFIDRVPCWKRRSGCFCDRNLANYLMNSVDTGEAQEVIDMQRDGASVQATQAASLASTRNHMKETARRPWKLQKTLCFNCPLYMEHQEYKYKHLGWLSFPATVGIIALLYPVFHMGYTAFADWMDASVQRLSDMGRLPENFTPSAGTLQDSMFEYFLLGVLGLLLLSYVIALTETAFLKLKL